MPSTSSKLKRIKSANDYFITHMVQEIFNKAKESPTLAYVEIKRLFDNKDPGYRGYTFIQIWDNEFQISVNYKQEATKKLHKRANTIKPFIKIQKKLRDVGIKTHVKRYYWIQINIELTKDFYTCFIHDDLQNININLPTEIINNIFDFVCIKSF